MTENELSHHGILGQRWGVRRYQNPDGSLTNAGRKRYDVDIEKRKTELSKAKEKVKEAQKKYNKATAYGMVNTANGNRYAKNVNKASIQYNIAKKSLSDEKAKEKLNKETNKSDHRIKLENEYLKRGYTREEAEIAAYKRARVEKALAITAGMTITAAAAYVAYKQYDKTVDKIIKAGTNLQNISNNSNRSINDAFYASMTKMDNIKYRGIYGNDIAKRNQKVYQTNIKVTSGLKMASDKNATKILADLATNNAKFESELHKHLRDSKGRYVGPDQIKTLNEAVKSLDKGRIDDKVYRALNLTLTDHNLPTSSYIHNMFYDAMRNNGYDAISDFNDKHISGFKSTNPVIIFNTAGKASIDSVREVGKDEIKRSLRIGYGDIIIKNNVPSIVGYGAAIAAVNVGIKQADTRTKDSIVMKYRREHPDSNLSYNDILKNYYS